MNKVNPNGRTMNGPLGSSGHPRLQRWILGSTPHTRYVTFGKSLKLPEPLSSLSNKDRNMNLMGVVVRVKDNSREPRAGLASGRHRRAFCCFLL